MLEKMFEDVEGGRKWHAGRGGLWKELTSKRAPERD
jgi:hypothetical protein